MSPPSNSVYLWVRRDKVNLFLVAKNQDTIANIKTQVVDILNNGKNPDDALSSDKIRLTVKSSDEKGVYRVLSDGKTVAGEGLKIETEVFLTFLKEDGWEKEHVAEFEPLNAEEEADPNISLQRKEKGKDKGKNKA